MSNQIALAERGIEPRMNASAVARSTTNLNAVLDEFEKRSGGASLGSDADNNYAVYLAGVGYINEQCDTYLEALDSYHKYLNRGKGYVNNLSTATDVILAAANVSNQAIGITAASFGLVSDSIEVTQNTLLAEVEPSGLRNLVEQHQGEYFDFVKDNKSDLSSEPATVLAIQGYLRTCLPTSMKSLVNRSVASAEVEIDDSENGRVLVNNQ